MRVTRDDQQQLLGLFGTDNVRLLVIIANAERTTIDTIERYLDGNGALAEIIDNGRMRAWVCVLRVRDCQFYVDRLASGLIGSKIVDSLDEAHERIAEVMFA